MAQSAIMLHILFHKQGDNIWHHKFPLGDR